MRQEDANRERLVQFLRDEDAQRASHFYWDFDTVVESTLCGTLGCAIGAAQHLGIIDIHPNSRMIADGPSEDELLCSALGLPVEMGNIFLDWDEYGVDQDGEVTAAMVADKIEEVAAEGWGE